MNHFNIPESCSVEPKTGNGGGGVIGCPCGQPSHAFTPTVSGGWRGQCLRCMIAKDIRKVRSELRQLNGFVPWWQTQEFRESRKAGAR